MAPSRSFDQIEGVMSRTSETARFTEKQGQYLAFIYMYGLVNGRPPAKADMQRFLRSHL